jgi:hypothetical protein
MAQHAPGLREVEALTLLPDDIIGAILEFKKNSARITVYRAPV